MNAQLSSGGPDRPSIAFAMGDPAGISPELAAKLLASPELRAAARIVVFGDQRILRGGADVAGVSLELDVVGPDSIPDASARPVMVDLRNLDPKDVQLATATLEGGHFATEIFVARSCTPIPVQPMRYSSRRSTRRRCVWPMTATTTRSASCDDVLGSAARPANSTCSAASGMPA